jgi:hypothetical protein
MKAEDYRQRHNRGRVEILRPIHDRKALIAERGKIINRLAQLKGNFSKEATQERARLQARQCAIWEILEDFA